MPGVPVAFDLSFWQQFRRLCKLASSVPVVDGRVSIPASLRTLRCFSGVRLPVDPHVFFSFSILPSATASPPATVVKQATRANKTHQHLRLWTYDIPGALGSGPCQKVEFYVMRRRSLQRLVSGVSRILARCLLHPCTTRHTKLRA